MATPRVQNRRFQETCTVFSCCEILADRTTVCSLLPVTAWLLLFPGPKRQQQRSTRRRAPPPWQPIWPWQSAASGLGLSKGEGLMPTYLACSPDLFYYRLRRAPQAVIRGTKASCILRIRSSVSRILAKANSRLHSPNLLHFDRRRKPRPGRVQRSNTTSRVRESGPWNSDINTASHKSH
jgi:hypothetical protein